MKWFKHDTDANMDAKLQEVLLDYGLEGYGLYWYCIELIAGKVGAENLTFSLEHDARIIARNTGSTTQKITEMMTRFVDVGLFEDNDGLVTCMRLAKRLDKSMTSNPEMRLAIEGIRKNHDSVMTQSAKPMQDKNRLEENRVDKNKDMVDQEFERFWLAGMTKQSKQKSKQAFEKQFKEACKSDKSTTAESFTDYLVFDVQQRLAAQMFGFDKMHPSTYLNQQRWNDDIAKPSQASGGNLNQSIGTLQSMQLAPQQPEGLLNHEQ